MKDIPSVKKLRKQRIKSILKRSEGGANLLLVIIGGEIHSVTPFQLERLEDIKALCRTFSRDFSIKWSRGVLESIAKFGSHKEQSDALDASITRWKTIIEEVK
jgi:hypothetical protein